MSPEQLLEARIEEMIAPRPAAKLFHVLVQASPLSAEPVPAVAYEHVSYQHEFTFVTEGRARVRTAAREFALSPGDLLLIGPGIDHVELPADPPVPYTMFWCALDNSYALLSHTTRPRPDNYQASPQLELHGRTNIQSLGVAIASELSTRPWGWQRSVRALLQYLGCILIRRIRRGQSVALSPSESPAIAHDPVMWEVVQSALEYCRANFDHSVRVTEVAKAVGYSASRLSHLFSSYVGESVADHLRGLRLARARDLLEHTDCTIADVAHQVGYGDPAHFTRAFVRTYDLSPNAYRKQLRGL